MHNPSVKQLVQLGFGCDVCGKTITAKRFCCETCTSTLPDNTFDICEPCTRKHNSAHRICRVDGFETSVSVYSSFSRTLLNRLECYCCKKFLGTIQADFSVVYVTYKDVLAQARSLATFLNRFARSDASRKPSFVAITGPNCVEWVVADFAVTFSGAVSVPIHTASDALQLIAMIRHSNSTVCICSLSQLEKIRLESDLPLRHVIVMDAATAPKGGRSDRFALYSWAQAVALQYEPVQWDVVREAAHSDELRTLLYTSGSTGAPKAAMIADHVLLSELARLSPRHPYAAFAFQPLAYSTQRVVCMEVVSNGGRMTFWDGNMATFFEQLRAATVSFFAAPPRIWNILYSTYQAKAAAARRQAEREGLAPDQAATLQQAVNKDIVGVFGPHCRDVSTGGATTSAAVLSWMRLVLGGANISVQEGYGVTEAGTIAINGVRVFECLVHLEDVPEMGYLGTDTPPRGLLWVHTKEMAGGYHGDAKNTAENFKDVHRDGRKWFNTGDIVEYDKRLETIRVIDRKKNIIKLAQSCFVAPDYLENVLTAVPLITTLWIHADSAQEFVLGVVQPNRSLLEQQARDVGIAFDSYEQLCAHPAMCRQVLEAMATVGRAQGLQPYELPRGVVLEPRLWTVEGGELTTSLKLSRIALSAIYGRTLARMYVSLGGVDTGAAAVPSSTAGGPKELSSSSIPADVFAELVSNVTHRAVAEIDWTQPLAYCGVDSSSLLHLCSLMRANSLVVPPLAVLMKEPLGTVRDAVCSGTIVEAAPLDWEAECALPTSLVAAIAAQPPTPSTGKILLTGASGFVGSFLLRDLLLQGHSVLCLVRAPDPTSGLQRLLSTHALALAGTGIHAHLGRITVLCGDAGKENFGLDKSQLLAMAGSVQVVVHAAAHVSGLLPYPLLRDSNVRATLTCLELAAISGARFIYVSSLSALAGLESGAEDGVPSVHSLAAMSGYGASKRVSEILIAKACVQGLRNCCVVRPGTVGPCEAGSLSPNDTITRYLCSIVELGISPAAREEISLCSVCDVAALVRLLVARPPAPTAHSPAWACYNVFGPSVIRPDTIAACARAHGWPVAIAPYAAFVRAVGAGRSACALSPLRSYFDSGFPLGLDRASPASAAQLFAANGVSRVVVGEAAIAQCYRWLVQAGKLRPPRPRDLLST